MKKGLYSLMVLILCVGIGLHAQGWSKDEAEIRGLIEKFGSSSFYMGTFPNPPATM